MKTMKFKCKLLSDVILNQKAATEGPNKTLDFIPGSCFLGIVASELYKEYGECEKTLNLFHSGKVRFGDAHPSSGGLRGLKIPASMFYPKLKKPSEELYIHHAVPKELLQSDDFKKKLLKQCRSGFYVFADNKATVVKTETNFAIKSAYDKDKRRSEDEKMYGYESLQKGLVLYFEVEVEDDKYVNEIKEALKGEKRVGRSRTAQYGLVKIEEYDYTEIGSNNRKEDHVTVYADGRLIFLDEFGLPTFRPNVKDLGLEDGEILWEKSQIRTFQYAPYNYQRQCFDADRCGIEKGSVFVVKTSQKEFKSQYVGAYKNEGFGKVIYNPDFLKAKIQHDQELKKDPEGHAVFTIYEKAGGNGNKPDIKQEINNLQKSSYDLCRYLATHKKDEFEEQTIYKMVNEFVDDGKRGGLFTRSGEKFASQWGQIRSLAMREKNYDKLSQLLFGESVDDKGKKSEDKEKGYLTHGVAAEKWENKRIDVVKRFFESIKENHLENRVSDAMINLAAEMAKEMRRKENNKHGNN